MLQSHIACLKFKAHKHLEPKGQATLAVISLKLVGVQGLEPWASRAQIERSTKLSYTPKYGLLCLLSPPQETPTYVLIST